MGDASLDFRVLGPLEVLGPGGQIPLGGRKQRVLLADLLVNQGVPITTDRLAFDLWGDDAPPSALTTIRAYISRLRKAMGRDMIRSDGRGYTLEVDPYRVDANRFQALIADAEAHNAAPATSIELYRKGLALWRGQPYGEVGSEAFAVNAVRELEETQVLAVERLYGIELELGNHEKIIPELAAATESHPFRERLWHHLMLALYRSGRQADALRTYRRASQLMGEQLGIAPGAALAGLEERILLQDPGLAYRVADLDRRKDPANPTNLREVTTSFLGRVGDLADVEAELRRNRVITLVGPGGMGKTRLAVEAGWAVLRDFPGGVWDIDFSVIDSGGDLASVIARSLPVAGGGASPLAAVAEFIGDRPTMLFIDNCEHVRDPLIALLEGLLDACPRLSILATSRAPLGLPVERVLDVGPLSTPTGTTSGHHPVTTYDAVALFEARGAAAHDGFKVTAANAGAVSTIVKSLDGMPLGIELAAAQLPLMTPSQIAEEVSSDTFPTLKARGADARHSTLTAALDWSHDLLSDDERTLFARLAVFQSWFSTEEASIACCDGRLPANTVPDLIESLVAKSLIDGPSTGMPDGESRYRFLETIKRYAHERLKTSGEARTFADRHMRAIAAIVGSAADHLHDSKQAFAYAQLSSIRVEVSAALDRAEERDPTMLKEMLDGLWWWWFIAGYADEAVERLSAVVTTNPPSALDLRLMAALALSTASGPTRAVGVHTHDDRVVALAKSVADSAQQFDQRSAAEALVAAGEALTVAGEYSEAEALLKDALGRFSELDLDWGKAWALLRLVRPAIYLHADVEMADRYIVAATEHARRADDLQVIAYTRIGWADRSRMFSEFTECVDAAREAFGLFEGLGLAARQITALSIETVGLIGLGRYAEARGQVDQIMRLADAHNASRWRAIGSLFLAELDFSEGEFAAAVRGTKSVLALADDGSGLGTRARTVHAESLHGLGEDIQAIEAIADALVAEFDAPWDRAEVERVRAEILIGLGRTEEALASLQGAVSGFAVMPTRHGLARTLEGLASLLVDSDPRRATAALALTGRLRDESGAVPPMPSRSRNAKLTARASVLLGASGFRAAWNEGTELGDDLANGLETLFGEDRPSVNA